MAKVKVLVKGYYLRDSDGQENACSTVSLVLDGNIVMVVDPGFLKDRQILIDALKKERLAPNDINIVCLTHSHIDHYANMGMFPNAKILEYYGIWEIDGRVKDWPERLTDSIQILKTPGHDETCLTLFVKTDEGVVAICGDVFWKENYPEIDPYAADLKKLEHSRKLVLQMSHWIIPGHAGIYKTKNGHRLQEMKSGKKVKIEVTENCRKCHKPFLKFKDKCLCQEWLCYRCCECEIDCKVCSCKIRK